MSFDLTRFVHVSKMQEPSCPGWGFKLFTTVHTYARADNQKEPHYDGNRDDASKQKILVALDTW